MTETVPVAPTDASPESTVNEMVAVSVPVTVAETSAKVTGRAATVALAVPDWLAIAPPGSAVKVAVTSVVPTGSAVVEHRAVPTPGDTVATGAEHSVVLGAPAVKVTVPVGWARGDVICEVTVADSGTESPNVDASMADTVTVPLAWSTVTVGVVVVSIWFGTAGSSS